MDKKEFLELIKKTKPNKEICKKIEDKYLCELNDQLMKIISINDNSFSVDGELVLLLTNQILEADKKYEYSFTKEGYIPIIDASDNDLIIYCINENKYAKYNTVDQCIYKEKAKFEEVL